jgi:hypothetical protein
MVEGVCVRGGGGGGGEQDRERARAHRMVGGWTVPGADGHSHLVLGPMERGGKADDIASHHASVQRTNGSSSTADKCAWHAARNAATRAVEGAASRHARSTAGRSNSGALRRWMNARDMAQNR